jgi:ribonuclease BN (tRNA processing enzyme)
VGLSVTVLGCSGSYPGPGRATSGYLVQSDKTNLWLDAGVGTFAELQQHIEPGDIDAIILTHAHVDHWIDIASAHTALAHFFDRRHVSVFGTEETRALAAPLVLKPGDDTYAWGTIDATSRLHFDDMEVRFARTDHPPETLAVRIDSGGRSLVYSSDTGAAFSLGDLGSDIDLALVEVGLPAHREDEFQHLTGTQAGEMARAAGVARLVVTHVAPDTDPEQQRRDAEVAFGQPVTAATPHARYEV